ncbi:MAG: PUA domain-containing protein, partial [Candidatus Bathyarchaeia archaeon]
MKNFEKEYDFFKANPRIEVMELKANERIIFIDSNPFIVQINKKLYPSLIFKDALDKLPKVIVDMGAIPHICNGSDIMAPGIKKIEGSFEPGSVVLVIDEKYSKPIAIGEA